MTKPNLSKSLRSIKSFLSRSKRQQVYLRALEQAYMEQSIELLRLQRKVNQA
jgi:hypothetical protein